MSNDVSIPTDLKQSIDRQTEGVAGSLLARMAERLGGVASVSAVYGTPIERDGVTIIPVARVSWGFGAGSGTGSGADGSGGGEGGGGGVRATPAGFIEIREGRAEFQPIRIRPHLWALALLVLAIGISSLFFLHGLRRVFRG